MDEPWHAKGMDEYRQEAAHVRDNDLRALLEKYSSKPEEVESLIPFARSALADCLMAKHYGQISKESETREILHAVQLCAAFLADQLALDSSMVTTQLQTFAFADDAAELNRLERGDSFAREGRVQDARVAIAALATWAGKALERTAAAKRGRPATGRPLFAGRALKALYKRLTERSPTRVTTPSKVYPFGHIETGEFGRFAGDFLELIGMKLTDDDLKNIIAATKVKKPGEMHPNSPLDGEDRLPPH